MYKLILILSAFWAIWIFTGCSSKEEPKESKTVAERKNEIEEKLIVPVVDTLTKAGEILPNKGMFQAVAALGVHDSISLRLVNVMRFKIDLTSIKAGEKIWVTYKEDMIHIDKFVYQPNIVTLHEFYADTSKKGFRYEETRLPTQVKFKVMEGSIESGSSLNDALLSLNIPRNLTQTVNGILLCKINFRVDARAGDKFKVVLRQEYFDSTIIDGRVLYASYNGVRTKFHEGFRYMEEDLKSSFNGHYTADGEALIHSGLRYPVDRLHISSTYGMRRHPVTGRRTMHYGVDYASPTGSPVYAVAQGTVIKSSYDRMNGNAIAIRHADRSTSYYLHLSKRGVGVGAKVRARQIIGRVGSTGRSTGPHLHFGFKNSRGKWMNPLQKRMIATPKLKGERLAHLKEQVKQIRGVLKTLDGGEAEPNTEQPSEGQAGNPSSKVQKISDKNQKKKAQSDKLSAKQTGKPKTL